MRRTSSEWEISKRDYRREQNRMRGEREAMEEAPNWPTHLLIPLPGDVDTAEGLISKVAERRRRKVEIPLSTPDATVGDLDSDGLALIMSSCVATANGIIVRVGSSTRPGVIQEVGDSGDQVSVLVSDTARAKTSAIVRSLTAVSGAGATTAS